MTARYCTTTHVYSPAVGAPVLTMEGAQRDSASAIVVANPSLFSVTAPVVGVGHINPSLFQYLAVHPAGRSSENRKRITRKRRMRHGSIHRSCRCRR